MAEHDHAHDHEHHDHGGLTYQGTTLDDETLTHIRETHPKLAENLELSRRYADLDEGEKENLVMTADECLEDAPWFPGFHSEGDTCAVCEKPTEPLFTDQFEDDLQMPYAAFALGLPVHLEHADQIHEKIPRPAPRVIDMARRKLMEDLTRPNPEMAAFFRRDTLANPNLDIEAWANGVLEENEDQMTRQLHKDIERCAIHVHERLYHSH